MEEEGRKEGRKEGNGELHSRLINCNVMMIKGRILFDTQYCSLWIRFYGSFE